MPPRPSRSDDAAAARSADAADLRGLVRTSLATGAAIAVPPLVTVVVVWYVASLLADAISPFVLALSWVPGTGQNALFLQAATVTILVLVIGSIGYLAAYRTVGQRLGERFDAFAASLPGVGPLYGSLDRMSELLVDADTESFRDVKLLEYPTEGSYVIAFETSEPPQVVLDAADAGEMVTLFMPMAQNPVLGGFVVHVSTDRVVDVDLTVEQGIRSIVTSGVALGQADAPDAGVPEAAE